MRIHRSSRPVNLSSGIRALRTTMVEQPVSCRTLPLSLLPIPLLPASYVTCPGTGTRQQQLGSVFHSLGRRQSWTRLDNDGSDHPGRDILGRCSVYGRCRVRRSCHYSCVRNLDVGMQRPLPGAPQTLLPVTGILRLQRVYLSSFWQCDQNDCTEITLDLIHVEVTEVDWILKSGWCPRDLWLSVPGSLLDEWCSLGLWCRY